MLNNIFKVDISKKNSNSECVFKGDKYRITVLSDVLLRLEYNEKGIFNDYLTALVSNRNFEKPQFVLKEDKNYITIQNSNFVLEYKKNTNFKSSALTPDVNLKVMIPNSDKVWYYSHPEAKRFKSTIYDFNNNNYNNGLYSFDGFSSLDDSKNYVFDDNGYVCTNPSDGIDIYLFVYNTNFEKALRSYFTLTSFPTFIPRDLLGIIWNKNELYNFKSLEELLNNFKSNDLPISQVLFGKYLLTGNNGNYSLNKNYISNLLTLSNYLHASKINLGVTLDPTKPISTTDDIYEEASKLINQTVPKDININVFDKASLDVYIESVIKYINSSNADMMFFDINDEKNKVNQFYLKHYAYLISQTNVNKRCIIMSRDTFTSSHRYPISYTGRTPISWDTLKMIPYLNSLASNIGMNYYSHDIGGFEGGMEEEELYARFVELGVFSPIFRFASESGRFYKREPWKWSIKTLNIVRDYMRLRYKLIPYLYNEFYKYSQFGSLVVRPLYYDYPSIIDEPRYKNEYYLGSSLLVAPIVQKKDEVMKTTVQRLYIPKGTWYDFKTGKMFPGDKRYIAFYKEEDYPVFAKSGSIIPLAVIDENNVNDTSSPKTMEVHVFPGVSNTYNLYEDDGKSKYYENGYYIINTFDYNYRENNYTLIIRPTAGKTGIITQNRNYIIRFRNTKYASDVETYINGGQIEHKKYIDKSDFVVEVQNIPVSSQLTVNCKGSNIEIDATRIINEEIDEIINELTIPTKLKEIISSLIFSNMEIKRKRIEIKKLKKSGLKEVFVRMFIKLLEYMEEI